MRPGRETRAGIACGVGINSHLVSHRPLCTGTIRRKKRSEPLLLVLSVMVQGAHQWDPNSGRTKPQGRTDRSRRKSKANVQLNLWRVSGQKVSCCGDQPDELRTVDPASRQCRALLTGAVQQSTAPVSSHPLLPSSLRASTVRSSLVFESYVQSWRDAEVLPSRTVSGRGQGPGDKKQPVCLNPSFSCSFSFFFFFRPCRRQ